MNPTHGAVRRELVSDFLSGRLGPQGQRVRAALTRVGTTLASKYKLVRLLGAGGMGDVYAAVHVRNQLRVAVKVLHRDLACDDVFCSHFLREGYLANVVSHPGTIHVLDDDVTEDGCPFLVMELLEGETLEQRWRRSGGRLEVDEVVRLIGALLDVLGAAHAHGIVHRDIKPDNVFLMKSGVLRLLDFGIALEESGWSEGTPPGTVLGTVGFMPPEQALGRNSDVDGRSDLWSVGALAFALLTGRLVHSGVATGELLLSTATLAVQPIAVIAPEVPGAVAAVIDRALAFERADRWASALAMREALMRAAEEVLERFAAIPIDLVEPSTRHGPATPVDRAQEAAQQAKLALAWTELVVPEPMVSDAAELKAWKRDLRHGRAFAIAGAAFVSAIASAVVMHAFRPKIAPSVEGAPLAAPGLVYPLDCSSTPEAGLADLRTAGEPGTASSPSARPAPSVSLPRSDAPAGVGGSNDRWSVPAWLPDPVHETRSTAPSVSRDCVPPYVIDDRGHVHFKSQCL